MSEESNKRYEFGVGFPEANFSNCAGYREADHTDEDAYWHMFWSGFGSSAYLWQEPVIDSTEKN